MTTVLAPFNIPLYYDSPDEFERKREQKFLREIKYNGDWSTPTEDIQKLLESHFNSCYPKLHKYNNTLGYVEFEIDDFDILMYYYLNGDRRKKHNRNIRYRGSRKAIFPPSNHIWGSTFRSRKNEEIRHAFSSCFVQLKEQCKEWNIYFNTEDIEEIIKFFDFETWLHSKSKNTCINNPTNE